MAFDWLSQYWDPEAQERQRIRSLGQTPPTGVTYEGPETPIDQPERELLFPRGVPDVQHRGALGDLAAQSMAPQQQTPETQDQNQREGPKSAPPRGGKPQSWFTNAPQALAKADKGMREAQDWSSVGGAVADIVKLVAGGVAGGAGAGAAGGAGAGAAGGAEAGAAGGVGGEAGAAGAAPGSATGAGSSQGGFGGYLQKYGGKLGSAYNKYSTGDTAGAIGDLAQYAQSSSGGGGGGGGGATGEGLGQAHYGTTPTSLTSDLFGTGAKRRSALARLGMLPEFSPELDTTSTYWAT